MLLTRPIFDGICAVVKSNQNGTGRLQPPRGLTADQINAKYNPTICTCNSELFGKPVCFGLTENYSDENPIDLHCLPFDTEGKEAFKYNLIQWVMVHPEFWHYAPSVIQARARNSVFGIIVTQRISVVLSHYFNDPDFSWVQYKAWAFTVAATDFLVANPKYLDVTDQRALIAVLVTESETFKVVKKLFWNGKGDPVLALFDFEKTISDARARIKASAPPSENIPPNVGPPQDSATQQGPAPPQAPEGAVSISDFLQFLQVKAKSDQAQAQSIAGLQNSVETVNSSVAGLERTTELHNQQIAELTTSTGRAHDRLDGAEGRLGGAEGRLDGVEASQKALQNSVRKLQRDQQINSLRDVMSGVGEGRSKKARLNWFRWLTENVPMDPDLHALLIAMSRFVEGLSYRWDCRRQPQASILREPTILQEPEERRSSWSGIADGVFGTKAHTVRTRYLCSVCGEFCHLPHQGKQKLFIEHPCQDDTKAGGRKPRMPAPGEKRARFSDHVEVRLYQVQLKAPSNGIGGDGIDVGGGGMPICLRAPWGPPIRTAMKQEDGGTKPKRYTFKDIVELLFLPGMNTGNLAEMENAKAEMNADYFQKKRQQVNHCLKHRSPEEICVDVFEYDSDDEFAEPDLLDEAEQLNFLDVFGYDDFHGEQEPDSDDEDDEFQPIRLDFDTPPAC